MKKGELNKKLRLTELQKEWPDVVKGLKGKTSFTDYDIKEALLSTGRSLNVNSQVFHNVVKSFIKALGSAFASKEMVGGVVTYYITSTEDALEKVGTKKSQKKCSSPKEKGLGNGLDTILERDHTNSNPNLLGGNPEEKETPKIPDEDKIRDLFKRSCYTSLDYAICLLAIFLRYSKTELSSKIIKAELFDLGIDPPNLSGCKGTISEIYSRLGFNTLIITRGSKSIWKMEGGRDLLEDYFTLCDLYKKLAGKKPRDLNEYASANSDKKAAERKYETLMEIQESQKRFQRDPRSEKDPEIVWKKWLLISASRNNLGGSRKVSALVSWIETNRHYTIDEKEAEKLYRELMEDSENELQYNPASSIVTMTEKGWNKLSKFYSPAKFKEEILVKLPLSPEIASNAFEGLTFKLDETTTSGMYLYTIEVNRSMKHELALKKLLRFVRVIGKIYTKNSWIIDRVKKIISMEDINEKTVNTLLLKLEEKL